MKIRGLINWCMMLLWMVATHHCILEHLGESSDRSPISNSSGSSSECPSHQDGDHSSHTEGKPCGTAIQATPASELRDVNQAFNPISDLFVEVLVRNSDYYRPPILSLFKAANKFATHHAQQTRSLSIAPNAPPSVFV